MPRTSCPLQGRPATRPALTLAITLAAAMAATLGSALVPVWAQGCSARSAATPPRVVELYTSEGCSSCPPADIWLSRLGARPDVIALGFHVNYWDRLGWPDRFADPAYTQRQVDWSARLGQRGVYTPQVIVDGNDWRGWPALPATPLGSTSASEAAPQLTLTRDSDGSVQAQVQPQTGSALRWRGFWAVTEDRHSSRVRAGENAGETLRHDHVVRLWRPVDAWPAQSGLSTRLEVGRGVDEHPRRVVFVITDLAGRRPLQAVALGRC